jgi:hypothetical protein
MPDIVMLRNVKKQLLQQYGVKQTAVSQIRESSKCEKGALLSTERRNIFKQNFLVKMSTNTSFNKLTKIITNPALSHIRESSKTK